MTDDERRIRDLVQTWMTASKAGDIAAVLALMTEDVVFMTPGRPPFGKRQFAADSEKMKNVALDGRAEIQELEIVGDRAYLRNHIQITVTAPGAPPKRLSGYAMTILRKEADGQWRLARDANLVLPDPA